MPRNTIFYLLVVFFASGCYCKDYVSGSGSVRFLRSLHHHSICYEGHGVKDGKKVLATAYTGDPYWNRSQLRHSDGAHVTGASFSSESLLGVRAETYFRLGPFPGPLLGIGPDYSFSRMKATYAVEKNKLPVPYTLHQQQHRVNLSLNLVTWIRSRMMGYITVQPGGVWTKNTLVTDQLPVKEGGYTGAFNWRAGYGFQFYVRPLVELNLELGYGGGAYGRVGIGFWVF